MTKIEINSPHTMDSRFNIHVQCTTQRIRGALAAMVQDDPYLILGSIN